MTTYFTLRYSVSDGINKAGGQVAASDGEIRIGQQEGADVRLPNDSPFADELFAVIRPLQGEEAAWVLVPTSQYVATMVNGTEVTLLHQLHDGDRISFSEGEQELTFRLHEDGKYTIGGGPVYIAAPMSRKLIAMLVAIPLLLFCALGSYVYSERSASEKLKKQKEMVKSSVLQISVDSVLYVRHGEDGDSILRRYSYVSDAGHAICGTAFLTADGRMVTARHCIEPWLNDGEVLTLDDPWQASSVPVQWALEAETYNQTNDDGVTYEVVALCTLSRGDLGVEPYGRTYKSSEFICDRSNDDIIDLGDFDRECYWRSVLRRHSRTDMMLGDIAYVNTADKGQIALPDTTMMRSLARNGQALCFMGYPEYQTTGFETSDGTLRLDYVSGEMLAHDGKLIHGYSGGPVMVMKDGVTYAIGVISVLDNSGGERTYSVPVTSMAREGGER